MAFSARCTPRQGSEDEVNFLKAMSKLACKFIVTREYGKDGDNMHMHAIIWSPKSTVQVRSTIQNCIGHKVGNGVFSLKAAKDDEAALRYVCKGGSQHPDPKGSPPEVVLRMGVTEDEVQTAYQAYWTQSETVKKSKAKVAFHVEVAQYMKDNHIEMSKRNVVKTVVDLTIQRKTVLNDYHILGVSKMILGKHDPKYRQEYCDRLVFRLDD